MALTVANLGRGNYVLGGPGRRQGPSAAEAMDLAQREEQRFRDAQRQARQVELGMQETRQAMALRQAAEQRAQQSFAAQQAARARAAADAAQRRAATTQLMEGLAGLNVPAGTGAAPSGTAIAPVAPPRPAGLAFPTGGVPLSFPTGGGAGMDTVTGGGGGDRIRVPRARQPVAGGGPALPERSFMGPDTMATRAGLAAPYVGTTAGAQPSLAATLADLGISPDVFAQLTPEDQAAIINYEDPTQTMRDRWSGAAEAYDPGQRGRGFLVETLTPGRAAETRAAEAATRRAVEAGTVERPARPGLPAAVDEEVTAATGVSPPSPEAAAAEAPTTPEEAAPTQETPWGGLQLSFGTPVELSFGEFDGRGSEAYVAAPERIFQDVELVNRQRQRLELLAQYYQQTNNLEGMIGIMNQLDELNIEQRYLDGMTAIVGIQQENFGPVQALLQQRYPGRQVEVRPYTNGTLDIFLDGESEARITWDELAQSLRNVYDRGFIAEQQALAEQALTRSNELWSLQTAEMLRTAREIAVANNQAQIDQLVQTGRIERIGETASGEVVFQTVENGVPIQFVYRETEGTDPAGEPTIYLVATPVSNAALRQ